MSIGAADRVGAAGTVGCEGLAEVWTTVVDRGGTLFLEFELVGLEPGELEAAADRVLFPSKEFTGREFVGSAAAIGVTRGVEVVWALVATAG